VTDRGHYNGHTLEDTSTLEITMHALITLFLEELLFNLKDQYRSLEEIRPILTVMSVFSTQQTPYMYVLMSLAPLERSLLE